IDLANGRFAGTTADELKRLFERFSTDPNKDRLVVHFHGGLVSQAAGTATAERLLPLYEGATGYPVFFVWHSGLFETINDNLSQIVEERIFRRLRDLVTQLAIGKARAQDDDRGALGLELPAMREVQLATVKAEDTPDTEIYRDEQTALRA